MYLFEGIYIQCFDKKLKFCVNSADLFVNTVFTVQAIVISSVVDLKLFILDPDPDPALNFPSSGSRSGPRQKFRIHADPDPDPTYIY